jgi:hypothetical protein
LGGAAAPPYRFYLVGQSCRFVHFSFRNLPPIASCVMSDSMKPIQGYHLIKPDDLSWRPSNLMRIPNA